GLALDSQSNVYVSSEVWSQDFPTTLGPSNTRSPNASMMALSKVNTNFSGVSSLVYSTLLGGADASRTNWGEWAERITVDANGNAYLAGESTSTDFPVTSDAFQSTLKSSSGNGTLSVFSPDASRILYSTYLGGTSTAWGDYVWDVKLDSNQNIWLFGYTNASDFPTTSGALQSTYGGGNHDTFLAALSTLSVPHISSVSPSAGRAETIVTIDGSI